MMIGAATSEPETPWLEIENVPPCTSAGASLPARAFSVSSVRRLRDLEQRKCLRAVDDRHDQALFAQRRADADIDVFIDLQRSSYQRPLTAGATFIAAADAATK